PEIEVNAGKGIGDESSGRDEARDMVVGDEIVVDSLWRMDELARAGGPASQQFKGSRGVVATDIDEGARMKAFEGREDRSGDLRVRLIARRAQPGIGRVREADEVAFADAGQIHDVALYQAANAMAGSENAQTGVEPPGRADRTAERLVDHSGGTPTL